MRRRLYRALGLLVLATVAAAAAASAQPPSDQQTPGAETPAAAAPATESVNEAATPVEASSPANSASPAAPAAKPAAAKPAAPKPPPPAPAPAKPLRSQTAYLRALDKVTAETIMFAAPIGQPVRYKNLVFTVKACETADAGQPSPQASAYLVVDEAPLAAEGIAPTPPRRVFTGWMFANSPGLDPLQHPIYDAWLIACTAAAPSA